MHPLKNTADEALIYTPFSLIRQIVLQIILPIGFGLLSIGLSIYLFRAVEDNLIRFFISPSIFIVGISLIKLAQKDPIWRCKFSADEIIAVRTLRRESFKTSDLKKIWVTGEPTNVEIVGEPLIEWYVHFEFFGAQFLSVRGTEEGSKLLADALNQVYFPKVKEKKPT